MKEVPHLRPPETGCVLAGASLASATDENDRVTWQRGYAGIR